jgi:hypothetical protein
MKLEREERHLSELAAHVSTPSFEVIEEEGSFWLSASEFARLSDAETGRASSVARRSSRC